MLTFNEFLQEAAPTQRMNKEKIYKKQSTVRNAVEKYVKQSFGVVDKDAMATLKTISELPASKRKTPIDKYLKKFYSIAVGDADYQEAFDELEVLLKYNS